MVSAMREVVSGHFRNNKIKPVPKRYGGRGGLTVQFIGKTKEGYDVLIYRKKRKIVDVIVE